MALKGHVPWNRGLRGAQVAWNKGTKGLIKPNKGSFKPGPDSPNWKGGVTLGANRKQYYYIQTMKRLAVKKKAKGSFTQEEWVRLKQTFASRCLRCGEFELKVGLSIDHVIPLSKGGTNNITNIQPLCKKCNSIKNSRVFDYRAIGRNQEKL